MRNIASVVVVLFLSACGGGGNATRYFRILVPSSPSVLPDACYQAATLPTATTPEEIAAEASCPAAARKKPTNMGSSSNTVSASSWTMVDTGDNKLYLVFSTGASTNGYEGTLNAGTYSFSAFQESFTKSCAPVTGATLVECNGACVNTRSDRNNCGACGDACPAGQACRFSNCVPMCTQQMQMCGGVLVDTQSNAMNCGFCNNVCMAGQICSGGTCSLPCAASCSDQYQAAACGAAREFSRKSETKIDFTIAGGSVKGTFGTTQSYACKDPGCPGDFTARCPTCAQSGTLTGREVTNVTEFEPR